VETSVRWASATETDGDNAEADENVSTEAPAADAAVALEVCVLESRFVFGWVVSVRFK
jgi:hypothetical protein